MEPASTVRTDALPAVATLVIPGALAGIPFAWALLAAVEPLRLYLDSHEGLAALVAILFALAVGFLVESLGSFVEVYLIDRLRRDHDQQLVAWWRYLRIAWNTEPIGQRYLRRLLVTFKFELNMCLACLSWFPGSLLLFASDTIDCVRALYISFGALLATVLFYTLARTSSGVLATLRRQLLAGVGEPPFNEAGNPVGRPSA